MLKTNGYNVPTLYLENNVGGGYQTKDFSYEEIKNYCNLMRTEGIVRIVYDSTILFGWISMITENDIPTITLVNSGIRVSIIAVEGGVYHFNITMVEEGE